MSYHFLFFAAIFLGPVLAYDGCSKYVLVNVSDGSYTRNGLFERDGISYTPNNLIIDEGYLHGCTCNIFTCFRKCCPKGYTMINESCQLLESELRFNIYNGEEYLDVSDNANFYVVYNNRCATNMFFRLTLKSEVIDAFFVQLDGRLYVPYYTFSSNVYYPDEYCLETFIDEDGSQELGALACNIKEQLHTYGMIISMPFLLLTFLVYAVLPDRNLHGKCLMCYVITLFCAYALLIFIQLYPIAIEAGACKTLGILCLFFFMVSFFWMNVMSIDICWTFSGMRGFSGSRKEAERKRFLVYCGYAWGMPFLLAMMVTGLSISADSDLNAWYNPGMGDGQCWFRDGIPTMLYFYLPMALLIIINLTLFCTTACKIKRVQQDTAMLRKDESNKQSYESDKQRFNLYLKLLLAMGVNWSMEIISWIVDWQIGQVPPPVWYITDFCNALYGVFIFFIFVFKQNIWKLLKRRYYMVIGKPSLARSMTQSAYSPRTTGSSLNHTVSNDKSYVNDSSVLTSEVA